MANAQYISDRGHGEISFSVPLMIRDVTAWGFLLKVESRPLQNFIDDQLNRVTSAVRYEVPSLFGCALIFHAWLEAKHCTSTSEVIGWLPDRESAFLVPVWQIRGRKRELKLWVPYLLINDQSGMVTGREVWGYRKSLATIDVPAQPRDPLNLVARTTIFDRFDPATQGRLDVLLRVTAEKKAAREPSLWNTPVEAVRALSSEPGLEDCAELAQQMFPQLFRAPRIGVVNLKQFRDAVDSTRACYQAFVESPVVLQRWGGGGLLNQSVRIEITNCASHGIVQDLGLGSPQGPVFEVRPLLAWWAQFDFSTAPGNVIWQALRAPRASRTRKPPRRSRR